MTQKQTQPLTQSKSIKNKIDVEKKVKQIIADHLEKDVSDLNFSSSFEDFELDEFDITELVMKWEDCFGIVIEDGDVLLLQKSDDVVDFVMKN